MRMLKKETWQYKLAAYIVSQGISLLGSSVVSLAIIWYVTLGTGSGSLVAGVTITTFLPQALVMLYGGILADRYPPKRIVILSDSMIALSTLILAIFFFSGIDNVGWVFFFNALRSFGTGIQLPASKSILPQIVPKEQLMRANSINTGVWSVIQLVSPGLGGLVMSLMDMEYVFLIDVLTAVISIIILATIIMPSCEILQRNENTREELVQGFRYIMNSRALRSAILLYTVFQFLVVPASQLTPLLASKNVGGEVWILSVIETAFSIGALSVSLFMAYRELKIPHFKLIGLSSIVFGMTLLLLLPARGILLFAAMMFLMGIGSPLYYTPLITHIQENTEESYMGRTFSYVDLLSSLSTPLGMMVFGPLANISILLPFVIPGIALILLGIWVQKKMQEK
ncbi:MFS transporter [Tissierella carlieri]|uniref:MFS transporter n=1 Tax=Tissierella carlieri TaxID=689904 RepID=A0ABT1S739_9FIRM|nr:MFS transporter [Tissierella carlieri]MBU5314504.1 MFS transporter [Tissierella carlieri]MCQ4922162.1 MFS transporter [Tissierella carlieri]